MKILMVALSIAILTLPMAMTCAKVNVPVWLLIMGHCGMFALGLIIAQMIWNRK